MCIPFGPKIKKERKIFFFEILTPKAMHIAFDPPAQAMHLHTFRVVARKERYAGRSAGPKNEVRALAGSKIAPKTTDEGQSFAKSSRRDRRLVANVLRQNSFLGPCLRIWLDPSKKYVCFLVVSHSRAPPLLRRRRARAEVGVRGRATGEEGPCHGPGWAVTLCGILVDLARWEFRPV